MEDPELASEIDLHTQEILLASSQHDLTTLRQLLRGYTFSDCNSVDVQDSETGYTPLHAAIAACETEEESHEVAATNGEPATTNGYSAQTNGMSTQEELIEGATETLKCLLQNGAIWNQLDHNDETPGCIAWRLGLKELYEIMVDAGVRAEMLLNRLEEYERLADEEEDGAPEEDAETREDVPQLTVNGGNVPEEHQAVAEVRSEQYLSSALLLSGDRLLDEQQNGVMMSWESTIMAQSADAILTAPGLNVLNVGFGMGIIDAYIQSHAKKPASHHIIEAHPDILASIRVQGWQEKPGVVIHEGKWQDVLPRLAASGERFDGIVFDTFAECYAQFRDFFSEHVIALLEQGGRWSYFNGMGADRQISYDIYQKVVEMELFESGFDIDWQEMELPVLEAQWNGVRRRYFNIAKYRLPVCRFMD